MEKRGASWSGKVSTNSTKLRPGGEGTFLHDFIHRQACRRAGRTDPRGTQVQMGCRRVTNEARFQASTPVYIMILHRSSFCTHSMSPNHHALARFSNHPYDLVCGMRRGRWCIRLGMLPS